MNPFIDLLTSLRGYLTVIGMITAIISKLVIEKGITKISIIDSLIYAGVIGVVIFFGLKRLAHPLRTDEISLFASVVSIVISLIALRIAFAVS